jgi:hypothetical protein
MLDRFHYSHTKSLATVSGFECTVIKISAKCVSTWFGECCAKSAFYQQPSSGKGV